MKYRFCWKKTNSRKFITDQNIVTSGHLNPGTLRVWQPFASTHFRFLNLWATLSILWVTILLFKSFKMKIYLKCLNEFQWKYLIKSYFTKMILIDKRQCITETYTTNISWQYAEKMAKGLFLSTLTHMICREGRECLICFHCNDHFSWLGRNL